MLEIAVTVDSTGIVSKSCRQFFNEDYPIHLFIYSHRLSCKCRCSWVAIVEIVDVGMCDKSVQNKRVAVELMSTIDHCCFLIDALMY